MNTVVISSAHTLNGELEDRDEQFAEFDKKVYRVRIADFPFNSELLHFLSTTRITTSPFIKQASPHQH